MSHQAFLASPVLLAILQDGHHQGANHLEHHPRHLERRLQYQVHLEGRLQYPVHHREDRLRYPVRHRERRPQYLERHPLYPAFHREAHQPRPAFPALRLVPLVLPPIQAFQPFRPEAQTRQAFPALRLASQGLPPVKATTCRRELPILLALLPEIPHRQTLLRQGRHRSTLALPPPTAQLQRN
jgi:hypothetical protein